MTTSKDIIEIIRILKPDMHIENKTNLLEAGILDSLSIMNLAIQLREQFHVDIDIFDITPENFATPEAIAELVTRKIG